MTGFDLPGREEDAVRITKLEDLLADARRECDQARAEIEKLGASRALAIETYENGSRAHEQTLRELYQVRAELASARRECDQWRKAYGEAYRAGWSRGQHRLCPRCGVELEREVREAEWVVARDGGRDCAKCGREIRRGQAYDPSPGLAGDQLLHVYCPDGDR